MYVHVLFKYLVRPEKRYGVDLVAASCQSPSTGIPAHPLTAAVISVQQRSQQLTKITSQCSNISSYPPTHPHQQIKDAEEIKNIQSYPV